MPSLDLERKAWHAGFRHVAGVDEAGRGPIAGPVVVATVILGTEWSLEHALDDSKKLTARQRESFFETIRKQALAYRILAIAPKKIDQLNILQATLFGMQRTIEQIRIPPDYVLVDGNKYPPTPVKGEAVVKGDQRSYSIAAASILAKVARDRIMKGYARIYPQWGFGKHKGYPTKAHRSAVDQFGLSPIHRRSFQCGTLPKPRPEQLDLF